MTRSADHLPRRMQHFFSIPRTGATGEANIHLERTIRSRSEPAMPEKGVYDVEQIEGLQEGGGLR